MSTYILTWPQGPTQSELCWLPWPHSHNDSSFTQSQCSHSGLSDLLWHTVAHLGAFCPLPERPRQSHTSYSSLLQVSSQILPPWRGLLRLPWLFVPYSVFPASVFLLSASLAPGLMLMYLLLVYCPSCHDVTWALWNRACLSLIAQHQRVVSCGGCPASIHWVNVQAYYPFSDSLFLHLAFFI